MRLIRPVLLGFWGLFALVAVSAAAFAAKGQLDRPGAASKEHCKSCHGPSAKAGEYAPLTLTQEQWERFFDKKFQPSHKNVVDEKHGGRQGPRTRSRRHSEEDREIRGRPRGGLREPRHLRLKESAMRKLTSPCALALAAGLAAFRLQAQAPPDPAPTPAAADAKQVAELKKRVEEASRRSPSRARNAPRSWRRSPPSTASTSPATSGSRPTRSGPTSRHGFDGLEIPEQPRQHALLLRRHRPALASEPRRGRQVHRPELCELSRFRRTTSTFNLSASLPWGCSRHR